MTTYIIVYLGAFLLVLLCTPVVINLAPRIGAMDRPGVRAVHRTPIPRIGGVAIFISAMMMMVVMLFLDNAIGQAFRDNRRQVIALFCSAAFVFMVGLIDDLRGLPVRLKFLAELSAVLALCAVGVKISSLRITNDLIVPLGGWGVLLTLLWIVGVTNAVNLSDGLDGLAAGVSAIVCGVIAILAVRSGSMVMAVLTLAMVGSLSGFLIFNFSPAKVFMGDCGSLFLGFTIATSSVMCMTKSSALVGLALPALALGIPIFDTLFSMLRRFLERRSLFAPDRSHFHHRLLDLGLHQRHAVIAIYLLTLFSAGLGLFMIVSEDFSVLIILAGVLILLLLLFHVAGGVRLGETWAGLQEKYTRAQIRKCDQAAFEHLQLRFRQVDDGRQWWQAVCEASDRMNFARISLRTVYDDGRIEMQTHRADDDSDGDNAVVTIIPIGSADGHVRREFEIAICVEDSVEAAGHRVTLFGRLLDENKSRCTGSCLVSTGRR